MSTHTFPPHPPSHDGPIDQDRVMANPALDVYSALENDLEDVKALAEMLQARFESDVSNITLEGPGLGVVARIMAEKLETLRTHAHGLLDLYDAATIGGAR